MYPSSRCLYVCVFASFCQGGRDCARQTGYLSQKKVLEAPGAVKNTRKHLENVETINQLLNLYDKVLDDIALKVETEPLRVHALLLQFGGVPLFFMKDGGFCLVHTDLTSLGLGWGVECLLFGMTYCTLMVALEFLVDDVHRTGNADLRIGKFA